MHREVKELWIRELRSKDISRQRVLVVLVAKVSPEQKCLDHPSWDAHVGVLVDTWCDDSPTGRGASNKWRAVDATSYERLAGPWLPVTIESVPTRSRRLTFPQRVDGR